MTRALTAFLHDLSELIEEAKYQSGYLRLEGKPGFSLDSACNGIDSVVTYAQSVVLPHDMATLPYAKALTSFTAALYGIQVAVQRSPETGKPLSIIADALDEAIRAFAAILQ